MLIKDVKIPQQFFFALQEASLDANNDLQDPIRGPFDLNADPWNFFSDTTNSLTKPYSTYLKTMGAC